ncbi:MAG: hypothetical protein KDI50_10780, partial [Candidatus Competibacteraceae bacterium]|nr:hypothetical protein [Candidatus Competibacteraceae bacterium]
MADPLGISFANGAEIADGARVALMGGKGSGLARMCQLGLPVPPGFTLTTEACKSYLVEGWTEAHETALVDCLTELEQVTDKRLGDQKRPLLVSIRSGAPISMPGMMDTVLNAGMTDDTARVLCDITSDSRFGWDTLRRFVQSYVSVVLGAPAELVREESEAHLGHDDGTGLSPEDLEYSAQKLRAAFADRGYRVPPEPLAQLREAVGAVFASWNGERAKTYRRLENISDDLFTAANVQMMAFGNLGGQSGTGVAFSRCPSDGKPELTGDFLQSAQGEDVVAGTHQTLPISALGKLWPNIYTELERTARLLEQDLRYLADIEFTVESGKFWMLQYRKGKHSPRAALRMAIDMAEDPSFPLTREEALNRVKDILQNPPMLAVESQQITSAKVIATGLAASPGQAIGALCTSIDDAIAAEGRGEPVILARRETSPSDIGGMAASAGILTTRGGLVSHAAVVARGWGIPAIVGAETIEVLKDGILVDGTHIPNGTEITVDGTSGEILLGSHQRDEVEAPEVSILRAWTRDVPGETAPRQGRGFGEEVNVQNVTRALSVKGMSDSQTLASVLGAPAEQIETVLSALLEAGEVVAMPRGRYRPTPEMSERIDAWFAEAAIRI